MELVDSSYIFLPRGKRARFYRWYFSIILLMLVAVSASVNNILLKLFPGKNFSFGILKVAYWPIALILILLITLYTFY